MSDEPEARMWEDEGPRYESRTRGAYFESAFASTEHLDRAPLLSEEIYTDVPVAPPADASHCHWRGLEPPSAIPQLVVALVLCGFFMICELIGGYLAGSLSVMCDAAHMLSDCGGFALALFAFRCAKRSPTEAMSYGYKRAEVLGAMVSVSLVWALTCVFVYVACARLLTPQYSIEADLMMLVSGCGVAFNVLLALVLAKGGIAHHHTHGGATCSHAQNNEGASFFGIFKRHEHKHANGSLVNGEYGMKDMSSAEASVVTGGSRNINLRAALVHVVGDLIQSCGVLLASILIKFYPQAKWLDSICTFVFSILVLITSSQVVKDALSMLMQAVPKDFRYREFLTSVSSLAGVRHVHSAHAWALSTDYTVLTAHVAIDELTDPEIVLSACQHIARDFNVQSATFQLERYSPDMARCAACVQPGLPA